MNFQRGARHDEPEISLIPLIDVVLVIIIFLMLTTTFTRISGLQINLPDGDGTTSEVRPDEISVAVTAGGEVLVNNAVVTLPEVAAIARALSAAAPTDGQEPIIVINADARSSHQSVVDVMQAAQHAGMGRITFAVQSSEE